HKYEGRALLLTTAACAMNCRFCFRRNFDYQENESFFEQELQAIEKNTSLSEIILSGGDPLSLSDEKLDALLEKLAKIPHLKRLRFHTRFPIGIPERIDTSFLDLLKRSHLQIFFVIHCNHPNELDEDIFAALKEIQKLGIPVLNQNVLLKGVNDDAKTLETLMRTLADHGILPYYLNQLDRVQGAAHFEVEEKKGQALMAEIARSLSGYTVPHYVREIPGNAQKTRI
ncbi:MAG: KamA family radical SAM protein, partial [Chlamydiales bacterium]